MNASPPTDVSLRWAPWWVLAFVALWPLPGPAETVLSLGAILALGALALSRFRGGIALLSHEAWALTTVLFFSYWLPELLSSPDAINPARALRESLLDLRYLPFLWLVAIAVAGERGRRITFGGLGVIAGVWTLGAIVQALTGTSPMYAALDALTRLFSDKGMCTASDLAALDRLSGAFGPCNLKLGLVLASLSPFVLHGAAVRFGKLGWYIAAALVGVVILLAGARAAWLTYALVLVFSGWRLLGWKRIGLTLLFGSVALVALGLGSPQVRERLERTTQAMSADAEGVDVALSGRTRIWSAAWCMIEKHPINGIGVRGFRKAFPACDPHPAVEAEWGKGAAYHAHQIVLEVLSETGVIGLLFWLSGVAMAWRAWRFASVEARDRARPAMLALAVTVFPFNTHLAFYSTFWGGLTLLLAALYAGSLLATGKAGAAPAPRRD
jgi:O-antigen ligase